MKKQIHRTHTYTLHTISEKKKKQQINHRNKSFGMSNVRIITETIFFNRSKFMY